jgi:hypothetical protein
MQTVLGLKELGQVAAKRELQEPGKSFHMLDQKRGWDARALGGRMCSLSLGWNAYKMGTH